jgi:hypothetical protein
MCVRRARLAGPPGLRTGVAVPIEETVRPRRKSEQPSKVNGDFCGVEVQTEAPPAAVAKIGGEPEYGSDARMMPMIVYELAAIGAAALAAASIWHNVRVQRRIRAVDVRLEKMQKEIEVLQMQESRRVMMALKGNAKVESPGLDPGDGASLIGKPRATPVP